MKRTKTTPPAQDDLAHDRHDEVYNAAQKAIEALSAELPAPDSAQSLAQLVSDAVERLCRYLEFPEEATTQLHGEPQWHPVIATTLADAAIRIVRATLAYARQKPEQIEGMLTEVMEWPAIASVNPLHDIRKVDRHPDSAAAKLYEPILSRLGRGAMFPNPRIRDEGIFHRIAAAAVETIRWLPGEPTIIRLSGLPWFLDYVDPHGVFTLPSNHRRAGQDREWAIALKYLLYLTLSPEPFRSELRTAWRNSRVEAFGSLNLSCVTEARLYDELRAKNPLSTPYRTSDPDVEDFHLPELLGGGSDDAVYESKPTWAWWWEDTLKHEADALFGHLKPLNNWSDPAVRRMVGAQAVKKNPRAAFGRCVDQIIDAFLHLRGASGGLKALTREGKPLPLIRANRMSFDDELSRQAEAAVGALRSVDK